MSVKALTEKFPRGSTWQAPASFHPGYPEFHSDKDGPLLLRVEYHTVGAGLRRNQDAGVAFRLVSGREGHLHISDPIALDALTPTGASTQ